MAEFTNRWLLRIHAAQRDLIEACGGIARVMEKTSMSKSQVGRWNGGVDRDVMPLPAVLVLEEDCGRPLITSIMAEFHGRQLSDARDGGEKIADLAARVATLVEQSGRLVVETVRAKSDGIVTPNEAIQLRKISTLIASLTAEIDDMLAGAQAGDRVVPLKGGA